MRIATFKQFNESSTSIELNKNMSNDGNFQFITSPTTVDATGLDLDKGTEAIINQQVSSKFDKLSEQDQEKVFRDLEKLTNVFGCDLEDLTYPTLVKEFIVEWANRKGISKWFIKEGFFTDFKDKVIKALGSVFEWTTATISFLSMMLYCFKGDFWGIVLSALALTISILVSGVIKKKFFRGGL